MNKFLLLQKRCIKYFNNVLEAISNISGIHKNSFWDKLSGMPNMSGLLVLLLIITLIILSGCIDKQEEIKIDINNTESGVVQLSPDDYNVVYFGFDIQSSLKDDARIYTPFLQYLSEETGHKFKIHFTSEYETKQSNLGKGVIQFAVLDPLSYIKAHDEYGVICLTRGLNTEGRGDYRAAIVTHPDSNITKIKDIRHRTFCFGSFDSIKGHLIPRKMLENETIRLNHLGQYGYTGSHKNSVEAIINGEYDAGGIGYMLASSLEKEDKLKIIAISDYYPSSGISANKDVDPELLENVKKALLNFDPEGKHAKNLRNWNKTEMPCGFIEANDSDYAELKELAIRYDVIEQEVVQRKLSINLT